MTTKKKKKKKPSKKRPNDLFCACGPRAGKTMCARCDDLSPLDEIPIGGMPARALVDGYQCKTCGSLWVSKAVGDAPASISDS